MTSVRRRTCAAGAAVAVLAAVLVDHGAVFGADLPQTALLGVAAGAVLGLVPHRSATERTLAFVAGFLAAWLGYALRAGVLPDIPMGRAIAAVVVVSVITAIATATADRLPLWSGLLGAGALIGAYEAVYTGTPSAFTDESTVAATSVLLAAAAGFVVTTLVASLPATAPVGAHAASDEYDVMSLDDLTTTVPSQRVIADVPTASETHR